MILLVAGLEHGLVYVIQMLGAWLVVIPTVTLCSDLPILQWSFFIHEIK